MVHHVPTDQTPDQQTPNPVDRARKIILRYGRNSTAYQIINPGFHRWFADDRGMVGYVRERKTGVAAGEPVCEAHDLVEIARRFEQSSRRKGITRICWFCAGSEFASRFRNRSDYSTIMIGAQPVWNPAMWQQKIDRHSSLRAQLRRARNKNVRVAEWPKERARDHPELKRCLHEWLDSHPFPPLHFLVEPQTLHRFFDRRIFVAERDGRAVGFVLLSPVPRRSGWLVEQFVRGAGAPNGTIELMLHHAVTTVAAEGYNYVTLGLAPLSKRAGIVAANPPLIRFLFGWLRLHGRRFYNFDGLDFFKAKVSPDYWEPIWAVANESRFSLRTLYAVASAFSKGSPLRALMRAFVKALRQEGRWLVRRLQSRPD